MTKKNSNNDLIIYNFDRPDKFSFDNLRSLDSLLSIFARNFATELSALLRMPAEIEVKKVEQVPFATEYTEKKEKDAHIFVVTNLDDKDQIIIQLDVGFLLCVHSKQGGGAFGKIETNKKSITEFEKLTVEYLVENCVYPPLSEAFKNVWDFKYSMERIETDPQYAKITLPQDMVAIVTLDVRVGNEYTQIQLIFPYLSIELFIERLNTDNVLKNRKTETPIEQLFYLQDHLLQIKRDFEVELGVTELKISEILSLEKDDVLILNQIEDPVICKFGGKAKFLGKITSVNGKKAVKLTGVIKPPPNKVEKVEKIKEELSKTELLNKTEG